MHPVSTCAHIFTGSPRTHSTCATRSHPTGSNAKTKLDEICKILGLPGKPEGVNGSNVEQMVAEGRIADVAHYCESDLVNTYLVWLRYLLFSGLITLEQLEWSEAQAAEFINARRMV